MPDKEKTNLRLEIAHMLFMDIVGYSKLLVDEQREALHELNQIVRGTEAVRQAEATGSLIRLPTGDGMALVFTSSKWWLSLPFSVATALRCRVWTPFIMRHFVLLVCGLGLALTARAQEVKPPAPPPEFDPATEPAVVAVARVLPAVVNIATERTIRQKVQDPLEDFYEQFFNAPSNRRPREYQQKVQSLGSGFLIDEDGDIVTNEHVVERAADLKIQVTFSDGVSLPARYVSGDAAADLALIKVDRADPKRGSKAFPFINLNNPSPNLLGETVLVLGNPLGYNSSVARGILSANDREITVEETNYKHLLQTDAAINPGNSGGPLIDLAGRLVGISSVKLAFTPQGTPTQGLGFAIPARAVAGKVAEFRDAAAHPETAKRANGNLSPNARRLFGLLLQPVASGGVGVAVGDVERGSPAAQAGFRPGMVIYKIGAYTADGVARVEALLKGVDGGTAVDFVVGTGRSTARLATVTLTAREES